jgi:alpha-kinase
MLVDLQGWLPKEGRGVVYLTDPQFHTLAHPTNPLSAGDHGLRGMLAFWETVHPQCNDICHALGLTRPQ